MSPERKSGENSQQYIDRGKRQPSLESSFSQSNQSPTERQLPPDINWRPLIEQMKSGDEEAFNQIYEYTLPIVNRVLATHHSTFNDEVRSTVTAINIPRALKNLKWDREGSSNTGEKITDTTVIKRLVSRVTYNEWINQQRKEQARMNRERRVRLEGDLGTKAPYQPRHTFSDLLTLSPEIQETFDSLFTEKEHELFNLRNEGKSFDDLAQHYQVHPKRIERHTAQMRKTTEQHILLPRGFKQITSYGAATAVLRGAYENEKLEVLTLLGRIYTRDEWVDAYRPYMRYSDTDLLNQGYILAASLPGNIQLIIRNYYLRNDSRVVKAHSFLYVRSRTDLEEILTVKGFSSSQVTSLFESYQKELSARTGYMQSSYEYSRKSVSETNSDTLPD
jgi:hypothetical protein